MFNKIRLFINNHFNLSVFLILTIVIFSLYGKTLFFDWTYLDDDVLILDKQDYLKFSNIKNIFSNSVFGNTADIGYRPILNISFLLDKYLYGLNPIGYHLTNILIFLFSVFFIYLIFSYKHDRLLSLFICIFISVHPILEGIVSWIPGRNDSLLVLFAAISFCLFYLYIKTNKKYYLSLHIICLLLCLFSKETAIVIPFLLFLFVLCFYKISKRQLFVLILLWLISCLVFVSFRCYALKYGSDLSFIYIVKNIYINFFVLVKYFYNILFPIKFNLNNFFVDFSLFIICLLLLIFVVIKFKYSNKKLIFFCCLSFIVFILPTIVRTQNVYSCNRIFLPMIFLLYLLLDIIDKKKINKYMFLIFIIVVTTYFSITFVEIDKFKNRWVFYNDAIAENPTDPFFYAKFGMMLSDLKMHKEAEEKLLKAIELDKYNYNHYNNLAVVYMKEREFKKAKEILLIAKNLKDDDENINYNLQQVKKYLNENE